MLTLFNMLQDSLIAELDDFDDMTLIQSFVN